MIMMLRHFIYLLLFVTSTLVVQIPKPVSLTKQEEGIMFINT